MGYTKTITQAGSGNSVPWIVDTWANPQSIGTNIAVTGTVSYSIQGACDDFSPGWDLTANTPDWVNLTAFTGLTTASNGQIPQGPWTMLRLTNSGTGTVTAKFVQAYAGITA